MRTMAASNDDDDDEEEEEDDDDEDYLKALRLRLLSVVFHWTFHVPSLELK